MTPMTAGEVTDDLEELHEFAPGPRRGWPRLDAKRGLAIAVAVLVVSAAVAVLVHRDGSGGEPATTVALEAPQVPAPGDIADPLPDTTITIPVTLPPVSLTTPPVRTPKPAVPVVPRPPSVPATTAVPRPPVKAGPALTEGGVYLASPDGSGLRKIVSGLVQGFAVSPDGSRLAFGRDGHLWTVNADGSGLTKVLANEPGRMICCGIHWSPAGDLLAFIASDGGPGERLWLAAPDGSGARKIADHPASGTPLLFTRDGSKLAFVQTGLELYDIASGELRTLWDKPVSPRLAWSGDDQRLAFLGGEYGRMIDIINVDGTGHRTLDGTDKIPGFLSWRATSDEVFYSDMYKSELWSVGADSGGPRMLMGNVDAAIPAPSGDRVALMAKDGFIGGSGAYKYVLDVAAGDLSHRVRVAESTSKGMLAGAWWSADGSVLVVRAITPSH